MDVVSPVPSIPQSFRSVRQFQEFGVTGFMAGIGEIVEETNTGVVNDAIYVAVAKEVKESKANLIWAIQNSGGRKIYILHVHVPDTMVPVLGTKFLVSALDKQEVEAYWEIERQKMHKTLNEYILICQQMGARAEKLHIEMECIERGIVELVSRNAICKLVMGAASDRSHSRKMMALKSKKAIYVREHAPAYCQIQFVCKGHLIYTRPNAESLQSTKMRSQSVTMGQKRENLSNIADQEFFRRAWSANDAHQGMTAAFSSPDDTEGSSSTPSNRLDTEVSTDESDGLSRRSPSVFSTLSDSGAVEATLTPNLISEKSVVEDSIGFSPDIRNLHRTSPPSVLDGGMDDTLYDQLERAMVEAENARRCAYQEALKRVKAEREAMDAISRAKASESLYKEVLKLRKEAEEALEKEREELKRIKGQRDKIKEELQLALNQKLSLENQIASSELMVKELEQKIISAEDLLTNCEKERDELQIQRDNALTEAEDLRKKQGEASTSSAYVPEMFSEFSFQEIEQATSNFDLSLKIGEGGYGSIYRGILRHADVAIKILHAENSSQGPSEFQQEVDVLSKLRHSNLVTLVGACPEIWTLVYEYLPNGSLEDRLSCKDNTPPLSWQTRIRIATELCSALIFLHSHKPYCIVHGDLKPSNILLDANLVSKLSDFGICRILSRLDSSNDDSTDCWRTGPKGTLVYIDPEFLQSGELTPKSDVYSFGIILLRLLTGRPALGITKEVKYALDTGKLKSLLDPLAGDWPLVLAEQLACLAMRCCEMTRKIRPDLHLDVWRILEPMNAFCGGTSSFNLGCQGPQPPSYFICPIFQEVMQDPHIAADGFTYEAEAIRGWLDSGNDTSPMTNVKLEHSNLVPNRSLRSAIQDLLQNH